MLGALDAISVELEAALIYRSDSRGHRRSPAAKAARLRTPGRFALTCTPPCSQVICNRCLAPTLPSLS